MKKSITLILFLTLIVMWNIKSKASERCYSIHFQSKLNVKVFSVPASVKAVENFLIWYRKNYHIISKIRMVDNTFVGDSNEVIYRVDFKQTEEYLSKLKSSTYISDKYVEKWRAYFKKSDEKLKKIKQNDGPPSGFEFDFVLWTQEIDQTLDAIDDIKFTSINENNNTSVIEVDIMMTLRFTLTKFNGKWQIDDIENI
jgi:hypothetical protein